MEADESAGATPDPKKTHPLHTTWIFYVNELPEKQSNDAKAKHEGHRIRRLGKCSTVEEFWTEFKKAEKPSELQFTEAYYLMREPYDPQWEKPEHAGGGRWRLRHTECGNADYLWCELVMSAIGEKLTQLVDADNDIVGVGVSPRPSSVVIEIWTSALDFEASKTEEFAQRFNNLLPQPFYFKLVYYESFADVKKKGASK
uniref:Eukaryotic initiation factor 4E n=1 Tax=Mesocestoides corti TaxID=53468 RepID=A0A5K3FYS5_MESCO